MIKEAIKTVFSSSSVPYIWKWSKKQHKYVLITSLLNVLIAGLSLYLSLCTKAIVDNAVSGNTSGIIKYAFIIVGILLLQILSSFIISRLNQYVKSKLQMNLRREMLNQILKKDYATISKFHSGELVNRMFSDVNTVVEGVTSIIPPLLCMATQLVGAVIILAGLDYRFVIVLCGVGILTLIVTLLFKGKMKGMHKDVQFKEGKVHASLQETVENTKLIKASGSEEHMEDIVQKKQVDFYESQMDRNKFTTFAGTGLRTLFYVSWVFALVWGCFGIAFGRYSYGTLMAIMQLVSQIQMPFRNLSSTLQQIYGTISSAERLMEIINIPDECEEEFTPESADTQYSRLEKIIIDKMSFSYDRENEVLSDVNITLDKGDFVAFTGLSGSGKSTLFLLMLGIYTPVSGSIYFKESDRNEIVSRKTRNVFAYVPQGNTLFSGTIRENLLMFNDKADEEELMRACSLACIRDFVDKELKDGLDTVIGERGIGLSEGQAQRFAIARALVSDAPILLLDESTSALDEETEAKLLENISNLNNKTCFIVTHRKAALKICNKRLNIEGTKVSIENI